MNGDDFDWILKTGATSSKETGPTRDMTGDGKGSRNSPTFRVFISVVLSGIIPVIELKLFLSNKLLKKITYVFI